MACLLTQRRLPSDDSAKVNEVANRLLDDYDTKVVFYSWSEKSWMRFSAQVYLERKDVEVFGTRTLQLFNEVDAEVARCGTPGCSRTE